MRKELPMLTGVDGTVAWYKASETSSGEIEEESLEQSSACNDLRTTKGVIFAGDVCGPQALHTAAHEG
jgi:hypothetical protein